MFVLAEGSGASAVAHGIHYAIVGVGVAGLVALIAPRFLAHPRAPRGGHQRALALRTALADPERATDDRATDPDPTQVAHHWSTRAPVLSTAQRVLLPLAVASSAAAAGVHAAVGPAHVHAGALIALFFAGSALLQLLWAGAAALRCARWLLVVGAVGNVAVVGLWAVTRTLGLPFGLLPAPEAVGPWDLACAGWELIVTCTCIAMLQSRGALPTGLVEWRLWHPVARWFVVGSVLALVALSLSGASA